MKVVIETNPLLQKVKRKTQEKLYKIIKFKT